MVINMSPKVYDNWSVMQNIHKVRKIFVAVDKHVNVV